MDFQVQVQGAAAGARQFYMQRLGEGLRRPSGCKTHHTLAAKTANTRLHQKRIGQQGEEVVVPLHSAFMRSHTEHYIQAWGLQYVNSTELMEQVQKRP